MKVILALLISTLPLVCMEAQNPYWGISINDILVLEKETGSNYEILPPPILYVHLGYTFDKHIGLELQAGYIFFADNWDGLDINLTFKYQIIKSISMSVGMDYNSIAGSSSGQGNLSPIYYKKDFVFFNLGISYSLIRGTFLEFVFSKPVNKDINYGHGSGSYENKQLKLLNRLRLGFGWNFSF